MSTVHDRCRWQCWLQGPKNKYSNYKDTNICQQCAIVADGNVGFKYQRRSTVTTRIQRYVNSARSLPMAMLSSSTKEGVL